MAEVQKHVIADTSPSAASTVVGSVARGLGEYDSLQIVAELTGATGGTLDVYLQFSTDNGTTWFDYVHFPQKAAASGLTRHLVPVAREWQPSAAITTIGKDASPALAVNTSVGGDWGNMIRAVYVAGASTSAGAAQTITIMGTRRRST